MKRYKVTPVSPSMILFVQVTIYALYAVFSLVLLFPAATLFLGYHFHGSFAVFFGGYILIIVSMFSIGMMVGGVAPNTKMAGIIASILYFPMLIFSGATLPYEVMPAALQKIADILPLTQGIKLLKSASLGFPVNNMLIPLIIMSVIAIIKLPQEGRKLPISSRSGSDPLAGLPTAIRLLNFLHTPFISHSCLSSIAFRR